MNTSITSIILSRMLVVFRTAKCLCLFPLFIAPCAGSVIAIDMDLIGIEQSTANVILCFREWYSGRPAEVLEYLATVTRSRNPKNIIEFRFRRLFATFLRTNQMTPENSPPTRPPSRLPKCNSHNAPPNAPHDTVLQCCQSP